MTSRGSRICGCCLVQLGVSEHCRLQLMRKMGDPLDVLEAEDAALAQLNAMPSRQVIRGKWARGRW